MKIMGNDILAQWSVRGILALLFVTYLGFGLFHLGQFQTADEDLWIGDPTRGRVHAYYDAWRNHDWVKTRINDKPGVTTALLSGSIGLLADRNPKDKILENGKIVDRYNPPIYEKRAFWFRFPLLLTNGLLLLLAFSLIRQYTENAEIALLATGFMFFSPILLGISQIVNPDTTLWSFSFIAILAYLLFLKTISWRYLLLAGIALGLALLSKYATIFTMLFLCFATILSLLFRYNSSRPREEYARLAFRTLLGYLGVIALTMIVFSLLMPAVFVKPEYLFEATFGFNARSREFLPYAAAFGGFYLLFIFDALFFKSVLLSFFSRRLSFLRAPLVIGFSGILLFTILFTAINWTFDNLFGMKNLAFDYGRGPLFERLDLLKQIAIEVRPLVFTITPITLFSIIALLSQSFRKRFRTNFLLLFLSSFIVFYYIAMIYDGLLVNTRYSIILYPITLLLAAMGIHTIIELIPKSSLRFAAMFLVIASGLLNLISIKPFYFNYTNNLLPKMYNVTGAWGYGGYEAAQYLNALPNAKNLLVWSDYDGFCPFFVGKCMEGSTVQKWYEDPSYEPIDYIVSSRRGKKLNSKSYNTIEDHQVIETIPSWELIIDDRPNNYIRILKVVTP